MVAYRPDQLRPIAMQFKTIPHKFSIAAFYDQILIVLYCGFYHFARDRPEIRGQRIVVAHRRQFRILAADETHLQMVDRQIVLVILFQQFLRQYRFAGVRRAGYYNNHSLVLSTFFTATQIPHS